jgi:hypothetical protein
MKSKQLQSIGVGLSLVLSLSVIGMLIAKNERQTMPSMTSSKPSGLRLFSQLLERNGVPMKLERTLSPVFQPNDLVVVARIPGDRETSEVFQKAMVKHLDEGGNILEIRMDDGFNDSSIAAANPVKVRSLLDREAEPFLVNLPNPSDSLVNVEEMSLIDNQSSVKQGLYEAIENAGSPVSSVRRQSKGYIWSFHNALPVSNRFLDKHDNAAFVMDHVRRMKKPGARVVFAEAGIGNVTQETILSLIGPWARATGWQVALLFGVVIFSLGVPFGVVRGKSVYQRGSRDVVHAVGQLLRRGRNIGYANQQIFEATRRRLFKKYGLHPGSPDSDIRKRAPENVADAFLRLSLKVKNDPSKISLDDWRAFEESSKLHHVKR